MSIMVSMNGSPGTIPDFWLPHRQEYHEVKGWMDQKSKTKLDRMARYFPDVKIKVIDGKFFKSIEKQKMCLLIPGWECPHTLTRKEWGIMLEREQHERSQKREGATS